MTAEVSSRSDAEHFERAVHACRCNERSILPKADAGRERSVIIEHFQFLPLLAHVHPAHTHTALHASPPVLTGCYGCCHDVDCGGCVRPTLAGGLFWDWCRSDEFTVEGAMGIKVDSSLQWHQSGRLLTSRNCNNSAFPAEIPTRSLASLGYCVVLFVRFYIYLFL